MSNFMPSMFMHTYTCIYFLLENLFLQIVFKYYLFIMYLLFFLCLVFVAVRGLSLMEACGLLVAVVSVVAEHRL